MPFQNDTDLPKGEMVYIRKRPFIDWQALYEKWKKGGISHNEIAKEAGVSIRTVFRHFKALANAGRDSK